MSNTSMTPRRLAAIQSRNLRSEILKLAWPAVTEQMLHMAVGMLDTIMVGRLGPAALASVGLGAQITMTFTSVFSAVATGTTALVARHVGAKEPDKASQVARQSMVLGFVLAAVVTVLTFCGAEFFLNLLFHRTDPAVRHDAASYICIISLAMITNFLLIITNGVLRGAGDTRTPMFITGLVNIVNVIGNYLLIFGIGPFPMMGIRGAALSTAISQGVGGITAITVVALGKGPIKISWRDSFRPHRETISRILRIGVPAAFELWVMRFGQILYTIIVSSLGTVAYAAHQVAQNAESLSFMPGFGFALAATTLVGQSLGARDPELAERSNIEAMKLAMGTMACLGVVLFLGADQLVRVFTDDAETIALGAQVLRIEALAQPALAAVMALNGGLRGAGDTVSVMTISAIGLCGTRVVLAYLLAIHFELGLVGAWIAMAVDLFIRAGLLWWRFKQGHWKYLHV
ncbi:MAG: MATE family efflux transporter [Limnochordia bacterium]|jgi:putative MATE family efflux protein|nr:MATE family efflux transporter [Limnochordia bacterium]MDD4518615.1 MATE family efflux transporter [Limnochordia bacterium]